jgi:hypothetical protein
MKKDKDKMDEVLEMLKLLAQRHQDVEERMKKIEETIQKKVSKES